MADFRGAGEDDAFLVVLDPANGELLGGWQFGGEGSERVYTLVLDEESGDIIVGGYTTGSLFATNGGWMHRGCFYCLFA